MRSSIATSSFSMDLIIRPIWLRGVQRLMLATASIARTGSPSWNLSPGRKRNVRKPRRRSGVDCDLACRRRRAKTDKIDGEALVRALLAYKRGEPRVCAMLRVPTPEEEDRRRISRERKALTNERVRHVNRIPN